MLLAGDFVVILLQFKEMSSRFAVFFLSVGVGLGVLCDFMGLVVDSFVDF